MTITSPSGDRKSKLQSQKEKQPEQLATDKTTRRTIQWEQQRLPTEEEEEEEEPQQQQQQQEQQRKQQTLAKVRALGTTGVCRKLPQLLLLWNLRGIAAIGESTMVGVTRIRDVPIKSRIPARLSSTQHSTAQHSSATHKGA